MGNTRNRKVIYDTQCNVRFPKRVMAGLKTVARRRTRALRRNVTVSDMLRDAGMKIVFDELGGK